MTPNGGTWLEKGEVNTPSNNTTWRKRRLLFTAVFAMLCILLLTVITGAVVYYYYAPLSKKAFLTADPCDAVLCSFGSQCLLDDSTQRPYCMCRERCMDIFAPVCGDDGVTYSSECQLRASSCTQQRKITISKQGSCDTPDPCETVECRFGSFCRTSFDGRTAQCVCPDKCSPTVSEQGAVCGTDGRNYPNECELQKVSCKEMRKIEIKFKGVCDPCEGVECPTSQTCQLDDERQPICRCNSVCSPDFRPVCGSDGKTYTNECTMRVEACKSKKSIRIIYTGECSSGANPCDSLQCGPIQSCDIDHHGKATCHCDDVCQPAVRLVCGSDGHTYHNECEMKKQGCNQKKMIKLLYRGECGERGSCYNFHCSYGAICVVKVGFPMCECPTCAEEFEPVCGTDGISYTNNCRLRREACEQKTEIAVAYLGLCTGCENKRCEYYAVCESDGRGNGKCVCPETCIQVESLVCGTDEVTYLNECEMRVAACKKAQYVMVVSKGPCDLCQGVHCKYGARCEEGKCVCPTECPRADEEVCANDGTTYRNECEMRSAACRHDQDLNVLFYGECDEVGETQDEGSGMEADCHERTCRYGGVCEYDSEGLPYCACAFQCPVILDPVCGSDGRLHDNECKLKEEACKLQKSVMPVHIEMCEDFREVPCDGEVPLFDPVTNKDYYCGDEIGAKLCPPGSYCHKSTAFAKCCREMILIKTCSESTFGCCPDGKTAAQGLYDAGCPNVCNCNRLGSYGLTCEPSTKQCFCKPGVGGPRCDRCEPGYWGLHRLTEENSDGCSPCACNLYGSVRDDCEQMTGRCVCKQGISGMKCDICPTGTVLGLDGCMDESIAQPVSGSCDDLFCFHGAVCREKEGDMAQCVCEPVCSQDDHLNEPVCASDGNTYSSECEMKLFACRYQKEMIVFRDGPCEKRSPSKIEKETQLLKLVQERKNTENSGPSVLSRISRYVDNKTSKITRLGKENSQAADSFHIPKVPSFELRGLIPFGRISVDIEFITYGENGVLFYCGNNKKNSTVYLALVIINKYLELRIKGVNESLVVRPPRQLKIGRHYHVFLRRLPHLVTVRLDRKWVAMSFCKEKYQRETFPNSFTLGSMPLQKTIFSSKEEKNLDFTGCLFKIHIGKYDLKFIRKMSKPILNVTHGIPVEFSTDKEKENRGIYSRNICFPLKYDYLLQVHKKKKHQEQLRTDVLEKMELGIEFRTVDKTFRLLTWKGTPSGRHLLKLDVKDGKLALSLEWDGERFYATNKIRIDDNETHNFTLHKSENQIEVYLDSTREIILQKPCSFPMNSGSIFILGQNIAHTNQTMEESQRTFHGCIQGFYLTNRLVDLRKVLPRKVLCKPS